jgi:thioredoxin-like negative regulator of GroEL
MLSHRSRITALAVAMGIGVFLSATPRAAREDAGVAEVQAHLGDLLYNGAKFREAARLYERAFGQADSPLRAHVGEQWVKALLRTAEFRRAREVAASVAEVESQDAEIVALEGDALWAAGLFDEAETRYQEALAIDPGVGRGRSGMAKALLSRSRPEAALVEAQAAVAAGPGDPEAYHTLAQVYQALRRYPDAAATLTTYLGLLPYKESTDMTVWARQHIRFLRAFGDKEPLKDRNGSAARVHRVRFRLVNDKVLVRGRVNGERDVEFVMDTGSEMTVITRPVAERLGVRPDIYTLSAGVGAIGMRGLLVGRLARLQIGSLDIEQVPVLIKSPPLVGLPTSEAEGFNPVALGYSVQVDYRNRVLTMAKAMPEPEAAGLRLPMRVNRLAVVRGVINRENPAPFVVDTGGEVISLSRSTFTALGLRPPRHIALKVYGTSGWDPDAFLMPGLHLAFERVQLENQAVVVLNLDAPSALLGFEVGGIVGHRFLSKYRVTIDVPRSETRLE